MSLEENIIRQVEFYFSDSNLPNDRFMRSQVADHPEGYVEIKIIASFQRMQKLSTNLNQIITAIKKSTLLEVDKDEKLVRRKTPLPEELDNDKRTVTLIGIPEEETIETIEKNYEKYGKINCVRIIKDKSTKKSKGIVSIEFNKEEEAKKFLEIKLENIKIQTKAEYFEEKKNKSKKK